MRRSPDRALGLTSIRGLQAWVASVGGLETGRIERRGLETDAEQQSCVETACREARPPVLFNGWLAQSSSIAGEQAVADAGFSLNQFLGGIRFQLFSQMRDIDPEVLGLFLGLRSPDSP